MKLHSPDRPLSCRECGSTFNSPEALALHVRLHSGDTSLVTDLCALTASLQTAGNFSLSIPQGVNNTNNHTNIQNNTIKQKSHICSHCGKAFAARHGLLQHNKRHPNGNCTVRTHVCSTCHKGFFQKNHLLLHQRQHMEQPRQQMDQQRQQMEQQRQQMEQPRQIEQTRQLVQQAPPPQPPSAPVVQHQ